MNVSCETCLCDVWLTFILYPVQHLDAPVNCPDVAGPSTLVCSFSAPLSCGGGGQVIVEIESADGFTVSSLAVPFTPRLLEGDVARCAVTQHLFEIENSDAVSGKVSSGSEF